MTYEEVIAELIKFRNDRNWQKYHNLKSLAISLNIEASEVLEHFQWSDNDNFTGSEKDSLEMELADVLTYAFYMCEKLDKNPLELVQQKIEINNNRSWNFDDESK